MRRGQQKFVAWALMAILFGSVLYGVLAPSKPRIWDTPFMREYSRVHQICVKLRWYAEAHPSSAVGDFSGKGIDDLAAAAILSQDDASYIQEHRIEFFGFDPARVAGDVPVLQSFITNSRGPHRIVGYSDGSTVAYNLDSRR